MGVCGENVCVRVCVLFVCTNDAAAHVPDVEGVQGVCMLKGTEGECVCILCSCCGIKLCTVMDVIIHLFAATAKPICSQLNVLIFFCAQVWRRSVATRKAAAARQVLSKNLFILHPVFREAILKVRS